MKLDKDIELVKESFPKLFYAEHENKRFIKGDLDICDSKGNYWDTFNIAVIIPENYPFGVPVLLELSKKIPRKESRHVSEIGQCCVDIDHELLYWAKRGISITDFIRDKVYPFFANQLYFEAKKKYANGEYKHRFDGIRQFYSEKLNLTDPSVIISILELVIANKLPGRNAKKCPCGKKVKYKFCHEKSIAFLKSVGAEKLKSDLVEFRKMIA